MEPQSPPPDDSSAGPDRISINFEKSSNYFTAPVNGAWGGLTQDGEVAATLYQERRTIPDIIEVEVREGVADPSEGDQISRGDILREIQATFLMSPEAAERIGEWLIGKARQARGQAPPDEDE